MNEDKVKAAKAARRTAVIGILSGLLMFAYGLYVSRGHITHIGHWLRLTAFEAETLFVLVDFLALYGKVMTSRRLTAKARRYGFKVMLFGLALSVVCNVMSGILSGSVGAAFYGLFVVVIIVIVEYGVSITKAKATQTASRSTGTAAPGSTVKAAHRNGRKCAVGCTCKRHTRTAVSVP